MLRSTVRKWRAGLETSLLELNTTRSSKRKVVADKCIEPWPVPLRTIISGHAMGLGKSRYFLQCKKEIVLHFFS